METEFYKSIPPEIREKLQEYVDKYHVCSHLNIKINNLQSFIEAFSWDITPEGHIFWENNFNNNTFPIWSAELNRFIDPPTPIDINENPNKFYPL